VFFDEPTLGLDPAGQRQVLRLIQAIARERGATVVLSTHFLAEVEETCTRVLILGRGRVVAEGTVAEVARRAAAPTRVGSRSSAERGPEWHRDRSSCSPTTRPARSSTPSRARRDRSS
jgi:ABC-2 type transport system ATP-binding protein